MCITPEPHDIHVHVCMCMLVYTVPRYAYWRVESLSRGQLEHSLPYIYIVNGILISGPPITIKGSHFVETIFGSIFKSYKCAHAIYDGNYTLLATSCACVCGY